MPIVVDDRFVIPDAELSWRFTPSGGPGGQHANRSSTRVELTWHPARSEAAEAALSEAERRRMVRRLGPVLTVAADDQRSQARNRETAERRLGQRIRESLVAEKERRATKPSAGARRRRLEAKRQRARDKQLRRKPGRDD